MAATYTALSAPIAPATAPDFRPCIALLQRLPDPGRKPESHGQSPHTKHSSASSPPSFSCSRFPACRRRCIGLRLNGFPTRRRRRPSRNPRVLFTHPIARFSFVISRHNPPQDRTLLVHVYSLGTRPFSRWSEINLRPVKNYFRPVAAGWAEIPLPPLGGRGGVSDHFLTSGLLGFPSKRLSDHLISFTDTNALAELICISIVMYFNNSICFISCMMYHPMNRCFNSRFHRTNNK